MTKRPLAIGITIGLRSTDESLWTNGIKQNALFLARLFQTSPLGHRVVLLNTTQVELTDGLAWNSKSLPTMAFDQGCDGLDIVIELGGQIDPGQTKRVKEQGTKLISYCCGPEYVQNIEAMIFRRPLWDRIFINPDYDELWIIPQIYDLNRGFLQTLRRCPVRQVPFVWDPMALEAEAARYANSGTYRPMQRAKRLAVIEPNIDVLKFCLYPVFIAENVYRRNANLIKFVHVANSDRLVHDNREFAEIMRHLDLAQDGKISFIGRVKTPQFLAEHSDIIVSHQWGLPLNYFYLECCWQGYPLIHNAEKIADLGYYYENSNIDEAADKLETALKEHDSYWDSYIVTQRSAIQRYLATNVELARQYDDIIFAGILND